MTTSSATKPNTQTMSIEELDVALPTSAHPTAMAFFDALDNKTGSKPALNSTSTALQRRSQSLGWRNRYSQNERYPVTIRMGGEESSNDRSFTIKQVQRGEVDGTYGTGATVWPAAMVLLKYLEKHPRLVEGKRVVDLGSGTGVTSVAAALLGASNVICTDGEASVVRLARENIEHAVAELSTTTVSSTAQGATTTIDHCPVAVQKFWWGTDPLPDNCCEVVLVADCVLPKLYPIAPLVEAIDQLLPKPDESSTRNSNCVAILSYEHRYYPDYDPRDKFRALASTRGLIVTVIDPEELDSIYSVDDIEIWHVTR